MIDVENMSSVERVLFNSSKGFKMKHCNMNEQDAEVAAWKDVKQTMSIEEDEFLIDVFSGKKVRNPNY